MFFRKEMAPLQVYGKLPLAKDYLRVGCGEGVARLLRVWMDEAFSTLTDGGVPEPAGPLRFLLGGAGGGGPVQGTLWPSSDAGGLRRFPFALLVERRLRPLLDDLREGLPLATAAWQHLEERCSELGRLEDGQTFLAAMRREQLAPGDLRPAALPPVDLLSWSRALWPEAGSHGLLALFQRLRNLGPGSSREPVRLPLVPGLAEVVQVSAWCRLLVESGQLRAGAVPNLFFTRSGKDAPAFVTLLPQSPRTADSPWLGPPVRSLGRGDLTPQSSVSAAPDRFDAPELPLSEGLLQVWSRGLAVGGA